MQQERRIFGNENAEKDDLLFECEVNIKKKIAGTKPILTGRWGTGKSATLILLNRDLSEHLQTLDPQLERIWYVDEKALDVATLSKEYSKQDRIVFRKWLERLWFAEILRRAILLLGNLSSYYGSPKGPHWDFLARFKKWNRVMVPIWSQLPNALKVLANFDEQRTDSVSELEDHLTVLFNEKAFEHVQKCLRDVASDDIQAVIAIEPIETPTSALEQEAGLAQEVVTALLNVFESHFQPHSRQQLQIYLAIPWHRYVPKVLNFPQKLTQYKGYLQWDVNELRTFINKRIEKEFRIARRSFTLKGDKDAWTALFGSHVRNDYCSPDGPEDSFEYALRHTHHRPREIQRLARKIVEKASESLERPVDDILASTGGISIRDSHIREAVAGYTREACNELTTEAGRGFPKISKAIDALRGLKVPFAVDDLAKRLDGVKDVTFAEAIDMLWQAGVIGVEVAAKNEDVVQKLKRLLPDRCYKFFVNVKKLEFHRWYFFEYNWEGDANELLKRFECDSDVSVRCVLHPKTFETLAIWVSRETPMGI